MKERWRNDGFMEEDGERERRVEQEMNEKGGKVKEDREQMKGGGKSPGWEDLKEDEKD